MDEMGIEFESYRNCTEIRPQVGELRLVLQQLVPRGTRAEKRIPLTVLK